MANMEIYYYSGTGNSLAVARDLAQGLVVSIAVSMARTRLFRPLFVGPAYHAAGCPGNYGFPREERS